jgi:putative membrane protein
MSNQELPQLLCVPQFSKLGIKLPNTRNSNGKEISMIARLISKRVTPFSAILLLALVSAFVPKGYCQYNSDTLPGKGVAGPVTTTPHSFADEAFVRSVLERDAGELQIAQLAAEKSQSDDVKGLGKQIIQARIELDSQFKPIAQSYEVSQPKGPSKKDKQTIAKLQGLTGAQFDEEFLQALAKNHRQDIKDFGVEASTAQDARVQSAAQQDGTGLSQQLQAIQQVAQAHNVSVDDKK